MFRNIVILSLVGTVLVAIGCGGSAPANNKPANASTNAVANTAPSGSATPAATPTNVVVDPPMNSNGATKTAANLTEKDVKKPAKPAATPGSGIPDPDAIRKSMGQAPPPPAANSNSSMMMMKKKPTPEKP